jgi:hypothetical protein
MREPASCPRTLVAAMATEGLSNGVLSKADIETVLAKDPSRVFFPVPQPGYVLSRVTTSWSESPTGPSDLVIRRRWRGASLFGIRRIARSFDWTQYGGTGSSISDSSAQAMSCL